jgi:simple sugar transport system ATP-binding protein
VISEDLDEVLSLADRVLVMYEGRIISDAIPRESTREALGLMMAGVETSIALSA